MAGKGSLLEISMASAGNHCNMAISSGVSASSLYSPLHRWTLLILLFLVTTSNYFDYYILSIVLDPLKREFGVSDSMLGILGGVCFSLCYAATSIPIARLADRGNRRVVIASALAVWSAMTIACAFARTFLQLAVARVGVGLAEPGATPPAQSLVADYFPTEQRALALTLVTQWGAGAGAVLGIGVGGYIATRWGWRMAFLAAGAPGLILSAVLGIVLPEPRCQLGFPSHSANAEGASQSLHRLFKKKTLRYLFAGTSAYTLFSYAAATFVPSFMARSLNASLPEISFYWGIDVTVANAVGAFVGGWVADRLGKRDIRWYAWLPAVAFSLAIPVYAAALYSTHLMPFVIVVSVGEGLLASGVCVTFAAVHAVCGAARRAMAIAALYLSFLLVGGAFGPLIAGLVSDALRSAYGVESLRYSLVWMLIVLPFAVAAFYLSGRAMPTDLEE